MTAEVKKSHKPLKTCDGWDGVRGASDRNTNATYFIISPDNPLTLSVLTCHQKNMKTTHLIYGSFTFSHLPVPLLLVCLKFPQDSRY